MQKWDVYVVNHDGICDKVNDFPFTLRDLDRFLAAVGSEVPSLFLLPAGSRSVAGTHISDLRVPLLTGSGEPT